MSSASTITMFGRFLLLVAGGCDVAASGPSGTAAAVVHIICRNDRRFISAIPFRVAWLVLVVVRYINPECLNLSCFEQTPLDSSP